LVKNITKIRKIIQKKFHALH
jgi:hypothetical protein